MSVTDIEGKTAMRIFVTGASGWIGNPTVEQLLQARHDVVGLARSDDAAEKVAATGASVLRGSLDDLDVLKAAATESDGVLHLAFRHDIAFTGDFLGAVEADRRAIETLGAALEGSDRPLVIASGTLGLPTGRVGTEQDMPDPGAHPRIANAHLALSLAERGVRSAVIRYAPTVHGSGDHGFIATLVDIARARQVAGYLGDGSNRWPAVHRFDAATLTRLVMEKAPAGSIWHATAEEGVPTRDIAAVIGRQLGVPVASIPAEEAPEHFGFLADFIGADAPASSALTRQALGWTPTGPGLLADLDAGVYTATS
jgi:nucleoside-diphosphate-sugar epimerase